VCNRLEFSIPNRINDNDNEWVSCGILEMGVTLFNFIILFESNNTELNSSGLQPTAYTA